MRVKHLAFGGQEGKILTLGSRAHKQDFLCRPRSCGQPALLHPNSFFEGWMHEGLNTLDLDEVARAEQFLQETGTTVWKVKMVGWGWVGFPLNHIPGGTVSALGRCSQTFQGQEKGKVVFGESSLSTLCSAKVALIAGVAPGRTRETAQSVV